MALTGNDNLWLNYPNNVSKNNMWTSVAEALGYNNEQAQSFANFKSVSDHSKSYNSSTAGSKIYSESDISIFRSKRNEDANLDSSAQNTAYTANLKYGGK